MLELSGKWRNLGLNVNGKCEETGKNRIDEIANLISCTRLQDKVTNTDLNNIRLDLTFCLFGDCVRSSELHVDHEHWTQEVILCEAVLYEDQSGSGKELLEITLMFAHRKNVWRKSFLRRTGEPIGVI